MTVAGSSFSSKRRGFAFVGSTICYALMQAAGLVKDALVGWYRYAIPETGAPQI